MNETKPPANTALDWTIEEWTPLGEQKDWPMLREIAAAELSQLREFKEKYREAMEHLLRATGRLVGGTPPSSDIDEFVCAEKLAERWRP